jgi:hypothetical protein
MDAESKKYFSDNSRFADTFNYLIYIGVAKIAEKFNVTKDYVLALLKPQET